MKRILTVVVTAVSLMFGSMAFAAEPLTGNPKHDSGKKTEQQLKEGRKISTAPAYSGGLTAKVSAKVQEAKKEHQAKKASEQNTNSSSSTSSSSTSTTSSSTTKK